MDVVGGTWMVSGVGAGVRLAHVLGFQDFPLGKRWEQGQGEAGLVAGTQ